MTINFGLGELRKKNLWRSTLAEMFGMALFLCSVSLVAQDWSANVDRSSNNMEIGLGIGLSITTCAVIIGHVSGGHLNPAVTLAMACVGNISILRAFFYIIAQMIGAITGSAIAYGLTPDAARGELGAVGLGRGVTPVQGFGLELVFTTVLVLFVLSITDDNKQVDTYAVVLGIGVCITVCHLFLVPMTGCGINPARAFGPAVVMKSWNNHWVYWVGPIVAAPLASFLHKFVLYHEKPVIDHTADQEVCMDEAEAIPMKANGAA